MGKRHHPRYREAVRPELEEDLGRFRTLLEDRLGGDLVTLVIFGSQVQGRERPESDLDVLLIVRGLPRQRFARRRLISPLLHAVGSDFAEAAAVILLTPDEAATVKPFYLGMLDGHRLLVDRGGFFQAILDRLVARLRELGARRLTDELGNSYWDLKPDYVLGEDVVL